VAVEGEFRRLVHYVDDLVDGRRAIRDDWRLVDFPRVCDCCVYCHELCVVGCVPSGLCPGRLFARGARRAVYTAAPSRMTARPQGSFTRLREASVVRASHQRAGRVCSQAFWPVVRWWVVRPWVPAVAFACCTETFVMQRMPARIVDRVRRETRSPARA
jgi:hypothetical protein